MTSTSQAILSEAELLELVQRRLPATMQRRFDVLIARRQAETLTADEHAELLQLTDCVEQLNVERLEYLVALARLRGTSLTQIMDDLGITTLSTHG